ncbi:hypothetical protein L1887_32335 [Cichorium endivia]|nr:hypothetical protein L1887_32335 [Cichorium endivia]
MDSTETALDGAEIVGGGRIDNMVGGGRTGRRQKRAREKSELLTLLFSQRCFFAYRVRGRVFIIAEWIMIK